MIGRASIHVLLHIDSIHHKAVGGLALAVDGQIAGVQVPRWIDASGNARHNDGTGQQG